MLDARRGDGPLRLTYVTTSLMHGGAENQVVSLATGFARRGHHVQVVSLRAPEAHVDALRDDGVSVASLGMERGHVDLTAPLRLARYVRDFGSDVVHAHMVHANVLARLARPFAWAPTLISTAHNVDEGGWRRTLAYRLTDALCDLTTNVADVATRRYVQIGAVPRRKITTVANGIDVSAFRQDDDVRATTRRHLGVGDAFTFLALVRLEPQKDLPTLFEAVRLLGDVDTRPMHVLVAGDGPLRESLARDAASLGVADRVTFLGARTDVPSLLGACDAVVSSSAWEGLPLALIEALAAGRPIVATDVGGCAEIVSEEAGGILVPPRHPRRLARAMADVARRSVEQRARQARAAVASAGRFDLDAVLRRWEALYRDGLEVRA